MTTAVQVTIKAVDARAVGRFWAEALGWSAHDAGATTYVGPGGVLVWPDPVGLGIDVGQGDVPWTCLSDPDGHEFCVLAAH